RKDPHPSPSEFNTDVYNYLAANPAPFKKFLEPFLCFVGISRYYELDVNCYPTYLTDDDEGGFADKPKVTRKKRKVASVASGSALPPKRLREDHDTSGDAGASIARKSVDVLQGLLDRSTLAVEVGVTVAATVPFVTSSVSLTPELLSYSPCHSSSNATDAEVSSIAKSLVSDPPIMTMDVATTVVADCSSVPVPRADNEPVHHTLFADSASI
ncbi:hypothetical protein Tco_0695240, partial [Tanacetum coccineum]